MIYSTIITNAGAAAIARCILDGTKLNIEKAAVGDGGGTCYTPDKGQTALVNEKWRGDIAAAELNPAAPNMIDVKVIVPDDVCGFTIREMALFSDSGICVAICNTPDIGKASSSSGVSGKLIMMMHIVVTDVSAVEIAVNPSLNTVSQEQMEAAIADALQNIPSSGVLSFNGRDGAVLPQEGDYTAEQVGARPDTWMPTAQEVGARPDAWMPTAQEVGADPAGSAAAVQQALQTALNSKITYGAADLTAGTSNLETGTVYLVYK